MEGEAPEEEKPLPDVPPPDFVNACKAVLLNFGNLGSDDDRGDLATRIKQLASEAEVVATRIYGKGMTLREQQVSNTSFTICFVAFYKRFLLVCTQLIPGPCMEGRDDFHF